MPLASSWRTRCNLPLDAALNKAACVGQDSETNLMVGDFQPRGQSMRSSYG